MMQELTDYQASDSSVLACAVFMAERIKSKNGHAAVIEKIVPIYLEKNDVDTAAHLADSVESSFARDNLLVEIVEKCAENDDDEYALQLAQAIEDKIFQEEARQRIAIQKANKGQLDKAVELAETVSHNSHALGAIALKLEENGEESQVYKTIEDIEDSSIKVEYLETLALNFSQKGETEKAANLLEQAREEARNIEIEEEKIRVFQSVSYTYGEIGRKDKTIEVLAEAQGFAELVEGAHRNALLSQISVGFLNSGSLELADRTLDLVDDKVIIAATLTHYAEDFYKKGEHSEAWEILEEARAILESQHEREVRNSQEKFSVLSSIATQFALFDKLERAIEVAFENPFDTERFSALTQIAQICASKNKEDLAKLAIKGINDDAKRLEALIAVSNMQQKNGQTEKALNTLRDAYEHLDDVGQVTICADLLNKFAVCFYKLEDNENARKSARSNIDNISKIFDESLKAIALTELGTVYEKLNFELNQDEKDALLALLR